MAIRVSMMFIQQRLSSPGFHEKNVHYFSHPVDTDKTIHQMKHYQQFNSNGCSSVRIIVLFLVAMWMAPGCQKESVSLNPESDCDIAVAKSNTHTPQFDAFAHIQNLVVKISGDPEFRDTVHSLVARRFDEDWDFLLKDLCRVQFSSAVLLSAMDSIEVELAVFEGIDGNNYYPHLFIPYFDQLRSSQTLGLHYPVVVVNLSDSTGHASGDSVSVSGIRIGALGIPEVIDNVTGFFARENEVWVLALNERVDDAGVFTTAQRRILSANPVS